MTGTPLHPTTHVVWDFVLQQEVNEVAMPRGAQVLAIAGDRGQIVLFAAVCPDNVYEMRTFAVVSSGQDLPDNRDRTYLGSVVGVGGHLSEHVLELDAAPAEPVMRLDVGDVDGGELMRVSAGIHRK